MQSGPWNYKGLFTIYPSIYALSMFIHYPKYMQRIPNGNLGLLFGRAYISKDFWVSVQGAYIWEVLFIGAYFWDFMAYECIGV